VTDTLSILRFGSFQAARQLHAAPKDRAEARLHGHGFQVALSAPEQSSELGHDWSASLDRLDHQALHTLMDDASDRGILNFLTEGFGSQRHEMALSSMPARGMRRNLDGEVTAWRAYRFESAHQLPHVPPGHKCGRLHGHGFQAVIHIPVSENSTGWNTDYQKLDLAWAPIHAQLHQHYLNDIPGLTNPTSEWLSVWIWEQLKAVLPELSWVTVFETASCGAHYDGEMHRIWKDFTIDSATEEAGMTLGHTWTVRLHLKGPLHPTFGWAMDFADVKREFDPLFRCLDHQPLTQVKGLLSPDSTGLAHWIRLHAHLVLPALGRVDLLDGCGGGATLDWGAGGIQVLAP